MTFHDITIGELKRRTVWANSHDVFTRYEKAQISGITKGLCVFTTLVFLMNVTSPAGLFILLLGVKRIRPGA